MDEEARMWLQKLAEITKTMDAKKIRLIYFFAVGLAKKKA